MDYTVPAILFVLGFVAALVAGGLLRPRLRGRAGRMPVEMGAVRLDRMAEGLPKAGRATSGPGKPVATVPAGPLAEGSGAGVKSRPRGGSGHRRK